MTSRSGSNLFVTRRRALALTAAAGGLLYATPRAHAVVRLDITQGNFQPMPIAIVVGCTPAVMFTGGQKLPIDVDELSELQG